MLARNTRHYLANSYPRVLGVGYVFIAMIDIVHALAYKRMNIFQGYGANLPTQLWIAARYPQAVTLGAAPFLVEHKFNDRAIFAGYAIATASLVALVFSGIFPNCFIEGKGLTSFKIISEYMITAILLSSLVPLYRKRVHSTRKYSASLSL